MTALSIQPTFPIFTDIDGQPLEDGYVFIGTANLPPITNPITVYWDAALTLAAAQPIRTLGGYPMNSGTPARLYVNSDYSIQVQNKNGSLIYSAPAAGDRFSDVVVQVDSSDVSFIQAGTGAVTRTAQAKMRDVVSVKDFGAVGDGSTDDTTAISNALTAAAGEALYFPASASFYRITNTLTIPADTMVYGDGYGSAIRQTTRERNVFAASNNCTIKGLRLRGDGVTSGGVDIAKNSGVVIIGARNVKVQECFMHEFEFNGVYCNNSTNIDISGNYIWGNAYSIGDGSDIVLYGTSGASRRINISKNFCLSNNSQGIYVDAIGTDTDVLIEGNICVTLDPSTWVEVVSGSLLRRHGVVVGYNGASGRYIVSANICRNTRQTGIYYQGGTASADGVQIIGNQCTKNGVNAISPDLASGIYVATQGNGDLIANNLVEDFSGTVLYGSAGIKVAPTQASQIASNPYTLVTNNIVRSSANCGILVTGRAFNVEVRGNGITNSASADIAIVPSAGLTNVLNHLIKENRIERTNTNFPGIIINFESSTFPMYVRNNYVLGSDKTVVASTNSGISWNTVSPNIYVTDNTISGFCYGVFQSNYLTGRSFSNQFIDRNTFINCVNGIMVSGTTFAPVLPVQDNVFVNCTNKTSGSGLGGGDVSYIAQRFGDKIYFQATSVPTVGTWIIGDRAQQATPVVGSPKGWVCTVAGNPGTWVSEGNL